MMSLLGFCTGTQLVTTFSMITRAFCPSGYTSGHLQTMRLDFSLICIHGAAWISPHCKYSSGISRILSDEQLNTHWKLSEVCQHTVNYVQTNLKTKLTLFATLQDKQSCRHCKTIDKNLHRHFPPCRSPKSR